MLTHHHNERLPLIDDCNPFSIKPVMKYDGMRRGAGEIPGEIENETEAIQAPFADPQLMMFPAAVTFLVPQRSAGL